MSKHIKSPKTRVQLYTWDGHMRPRDMVILQRIVILEIVAAVINNCFFVMFHLIWHRCREEGHLRIFL